MAYSIPLFTSHYSVNPTRKHTRPTHSGWILEMGRTAAACSRSQRFGLGDQWRFSVDLEIHPPFAVEVPT